MLRGLTAPTPAPGSLWDPIPGHCRCRLRQARATGVVALAGRGKDRRPDPLPPVGTARDLVATLDILNTIFFGPEIKSGQVSFESDRAVLPVRMCPMLLREQDFYAHNGDVFNRCHACVVAAVEELNHEYTIRYVRGMCQGDRNGEMKIITKKLQKKRKKRDDQVLLLPDPAALLPLFLVELLVILLGRIEWGGRYDLGYDRPPAIAPRLCEFFPGLPGQGVLFFRMVKDGRAVVGAVIRSLTVELGRVVDRPEQV